MRNKRSIIYSLFLACVLSLWIGCTSEEIIERSGKGETVTVTLALSAVPMTEGDSGLQTKSETEEVFEAEKSELMYSATVFLCDSKGKIVKKVSVEDLEDTDNYFFVNDTVRLEKDEVDEAYTLYGFTNCKGYSEELDEDLDLDENATMPENVTGNTMVIEDPAGKIDFGKKKYIPMTGFQEVTIETNKEEPQKISVAVDRLVSKAKFEITYPAGQDDSDPVTIESLELEGNRVRVPLFSKTEYTTEERGEGKSISLIQESIANFKVGDSLKVQPALYLNESLLRNPYRLKMKIKGETDCRYGSFNRQMTRNHVRPIEIQIANIKLWVEGFYNNNPIGAILDPVAFSHAYTLEMQEGSTFNLQLHLKSRGKNVTTERISNVQWKGELKGRGWLTEPLSFKDETLENGETVSRCRLKGAVPANGQGDGEAVLNITLTYHDNLLDKDRPDYMRELKFTLYLQRKALNPDHSSTRSLPRGFSWEDIIEM